MRIIATLIVLLAVLWLGSRTITGGLQTAIAPAPGASAPAANPAQRAADRITDAVQQGAAQRASDAAGR